MHYVSEIKLGCECGGKASLSGEVLDCWFESGSMPYAQMHYPFENQDQFKLGFPADFIAESIDQTRGWFYSLLVIATALFDDTAYKNVVVSGLILAENGQKMSKRKKNYPEIEDLISRKGADAMRFYLMSSPAVKAGDLNFSEKGVDEVVKKVILTLWNSYSFFVTYASLDNWEPDEEGDFTESKRPLMDRWLISRRNTLVKNVTEAMEAYDLSKAARFLSEFMDELSNWYIRRSRKRFWKSEDDSDKKAAYHTLYDTLTAYISLLAPFMPFVAEEIYQNMKAWRTGKAESVHLSDWPKVDEAMIDEALEAQMSLVRQIIEAGLSERNEKGIKVRQPLHSLVVTHPGVGESLDHALLSVVMDEVNVKEVLIKSGKEFTSNLDTKITQELKAEGIARDFVRFIQDGRKKAGFNVEDRIETNWNTEDKDVAVAVSSQKDYIAKETLSVTFSEGKNETEYSETIKLDGKEVWFGISRKSK